MSSIIFCDTYIYQAVKANYKVQLAGFGTFECHEFAAREGKNLQMGAKIKIAACKSPIFHFLAICI